MRAALLATILISGLRAEQAPHLPDWLKAEPGAEAETVQCGPRSVVLSYQISQPAEGVVEFYRAQIQKAGLKADANYDGIGTSIRVLAPGASSVITVREGDLGTRVKVEYAIASIQLPNTRNATCFEGTRIYYSESRGRSVCSEPAPLALLWPGWLNPRGDRRLDDPKNMAMPVGWYGDPSLTRRFESGESLEAMFEYYRQVFRVHGLTSWGQLQPEGSWMRAMQRPVKNVALDPQHVLPEFSNVQYVRQVYVLLARAASGTQITIILQVHNPRREVQSMSFRQH